MSDSPPTDRCFWVQQLAKSVNISPSSSRLVVRRRAAIGDVVASTAVADRLTQLGYAVAFQCDPIIAPLMARQRNIRARLPMDQRCHVNLDDAYENHPLRTRLHFNELFFAAADRQLKMGGISLGKPINATPSLVVMDSEKMGPMERLSPFPRPWVFICPRSNSWPNRTIQDCIWQKVATQVKGTCFWLGTNDAPQGIEDLKMRSIFHLPVWLACADLLATVDTGPLHLAAAVGTPALVFEQASSADLHLTDQRDFRSVKHPTLTCTNCQKNVCPFGKHLPPCQNWPSELMADEINRSLKAMTTDSISAVVPVFRPPVERLNRCLDCVLPQVDEIVVTRDAGGAFPIGARADQKIHYVTAREANLGFGKNVNYGFRQTTGRYVLVLNDDVFLKPDAVRHLMAAMGPDIGIVGHLLYYEDGRIQHGGKYRAPGMRGWGHVDHKKFLPTIRHPVDMEVVTGASVLIQRKAFYKAMGFNEAFFMYAEDDALCMQIRQQGYRVRYTPLAVGTHLESQSAAHLPDIAKRIREANATFWRYWGWWIEKNLNRVPGVFA